MSLKSSVGLLVLGIVCLSCSPSEDPQGEVHCSFEKQILAAQAAPAATVTEAHLYLDTSDTMKGFLSDAENPMPVTLFQELLQSLLLEKIHAAGLANFRASGFGKDRSSSSFAPLSVPPDVYHKCRDLAYPKDSDGAAPPLYAYARCRSLYSDNESDIIGALEEASSQPSTLSLVVTDNVQDLLHARPNRAPGFDRAAFIRTVVDDLAKKGFGVWLVGFKSGFHGDYFSVQLTLGRHEVRTNQTLCLSSPRPVFCWIVSRDFAKGRQLAGSLTEELLRWDKGHRTQGESEVHALELAPGIFPGLHVVEPTEAELSPTDGESSTGARGLRDVLRARSWSTHPETYAIGDADLVFRDAPRTQSLLFLLKVTLEPPPPSLVPLTLPPSAWKLTPGETLDLGTIASTDLSGFAVSPSESNRYWKLAVPYDRFVAAALPARQIEVPINLEVNLDSLPSWVGLWSTDKDTTKQVTDGKTLYFLDVVRGILTETFGSSTKGCLHVSLPKE